MKKTSVFVALCAALSLSGCSYAGIATTTDGKVIVTRNDTILFGALRKVYVCSVGATGLENCTAGEAP